MTVIAHIVSTKEVEIPDFDDLTYAEIISRAEEATGVPFGDPEAEAIIDGIYLLDGRAIIEW